MRILYHHRTRSRDGQSVHIEELISAFRAMGHDVLVVAPPATEAASFGDDGGPVARIKQLLPKSIYELLELAYSLIAFARLFRAARDFQPDILYERYNLFLLAGWLLRRLTGLPMLLEINSPLAEERERFGGLGWPALARASERLVWRGADACLPVTGVLAEMIGAAGVARSRLHVIPNGVGHEYLHPRADGLDVRRRHRLESSTVLGFTGFVREWHGLDRVIDLLARRSDPSLAFLVVGDGPAVPALKAQAKRLGLGQQVVFTGLVGRADVPAHVAAFDIALQPHVVGYASPLKLFEYMALARPIIAPATPNIKEILSHERDSLLFDIGRAHTFSDAIERLLGDRALCQRLGAGARETLERRNLTWAGNADTVTRIAMELCAGRPTAQGGGPRR